MAEEPGKCRYIMGILEKNKKSKGTAFVYDENNDYYKMEINGIEFVCDSIHSDYEKHAVELAQAYEKRLPDIVDYLMPDIKEMFGITNPDVIANSLYGSFRGEFPAGGFCGAGGVVAESAFRPLVVVAGFYFAHTTDVRL